MDPCPPRYGPSSDAAVVDLIRRHPFAWIVSEHGDFSATPAPLIPDLDPAGALVALKGHFGRGNPHVASLQAQSRCLVLFQGEHGYISPSWFEDRTQAPSWNYETLAFECDLHLIDQTDEIRAHLAELVAIHEVGRPNAWAMTEMGPRLDRLARGVIAFRADIRDRRTVFKLGQDERPDVFADIVEGLRRTGHHALAGRMTCEIAAHR